MDMDKATADYMVASLKRDLNSVASTLEDRARELRAFVALMDKETDPMALVGARPFLSNVIRVTEDARRPVLNSMSANGIVESAAQIAFATKQEG